METFFEIEFYNKYEKILTCEAKIFNLLSTTYFRTEDSSLQMPGKFAVFIAEEPKIFDMINLRQIVDNKLCKYWIILDCKSYFMKDFINKGWRIDIKYQSYITGDINSFQKVVSDL